MAEISEFFFEICKVYVTTFPSMPVGLHSLPGGESIFMCTFSLTLTGDKLEQHGSHMSAGDQDGVNTDHRKGDLSMEIFWYYSADIFRSEIFWYGPQKMM